ncbi:MAG: tRNA pseudouridine(38-40) synthase TruA [Desulfovibrionaceae bacterium]|nr:tRNA pseudouridine(38-40) synthase TruA [Desulfovibrionaceae bacterium]
MSCVDFSKLPVQRLQLQICYQGSAYHGWQIQAPKQPPDTIQGWLEWAFLRLTGAALRVTGAGRTDAGVHALGQIAHIDVPRELINRPWQRGLNALLPQDIRVVKVAQVAQSFHARFSARSKTYIYHLWPEQSFVPPERYPFVWACGPLDLRAMEAALPFFLGCQDFASLQNRGTDLKTTVRDISSLKLYPLPLNPYLPPHTPEICLEVTANGFLKQMVRNLTGLLVWVGRNLLQPDDIKTVLAAKAREFSPYPTAPAKGLTLASILY